MAEPARRRHEPSERRRVAMFFASLGGGGMERSMLLTAGALVERGFAVELVLCRAEGPLLDQVPPGVGVVELQPGSLWLARAAALRADPAGVGAMLRPVLLSWKPPGRLHYLPALVRYLRRERPDALLAAVSMPNVLAIWARRLAKVPTRVIVSQRNHLSRIIADSTKWRHRHLPALIGRTYPMADAIVAVSEGVADDLAAVSGLPREAIRTIYNPVVHPDLDRLARQPPDHPWFGPDDPPVLLGVGSLIEQKDFPTLIRAFARVRARRAARLVILGAARGAARDAAARAGLLAVATELGVAADLDLPGFVANPFAYMARAAVFVLSSAWEGLPGVLIQALACGCPVVSTDCPSGPAEILDRGRYGRLAPVGDDAALAEAIVRTLDAPPERAGLRARAALFSVERAVDQYLELLPAQALRS